MDQRQSAEADRAVGIPYSKAISIHNNFTMKRSKMQPFLQPKSQKYRAHFWRICTKRHAPSRQREGAWRFLHFDFTLLVTVQPMFKFGFVGEYAGGTSCKKFPQTPSRTFKKYSQKILPNISFFKFFEVQKLFFKKVSGGVQG